MTARHIVLSPHFDDAVLSLGGLLAREGSRASVITFFTGKPTESMRTDWDARCGFSDSDAAIVSRTQENEAALRSLGISRTLNLSYLDGQYRDEQPTFEELGASLREAVSALIDPASGEEIHIYAPGLSMHPDHDLVKQAFLLYAQETPGVSSYLYQDMPYATWLLDTSAEDSSVISERICGSRKADLHLIPLSEAALSEKLSAIRHYASQYEPLGGDAMLQGVQDIAQRQAAWLQADAPYCEVVYKV